MAGERILIVEDEYINQLSIKQSLRKMGYVVAGSAASGKEAIEKATELKPDLILMDITLKGGMSGLDAAAEILKKQDLEVVYLTAHSSKDAFEHASETDFSGYIIKPFTDKELENTVAEALMKRKAK